MYKEKHQSTEMCKKFSIFAHEIRAYAVVFCILSLAVGLSLQERFGLQLASRSGSVTVVISLFLFQVTRYAHQQTVNMLEFDLAAATEDWKKQIAKPVPGRPGVAKLDLNPTPRLAFFRSAKKRVNEDWSAVLQTEIIVAGFGTIQWGFGDLVASCIIGTEC